MFQCSKGETFTCKSKGRGKQLPFGAKPKHIYILCWNDSSTAVKFGILENVISKYNLENNF
jgi:hypothetical protein